MRKITGALQRLEEFLIAVSFSIMVVSSFAQVVNRNFVGGGVSWFEELSRYCMIYMALLATELGLRDGTQGAVSAFTDKCGRVSRLALSTISQAIVIVFSVIVFVTSFQLLQKQVAYGAHSAGLDIPMYIPYFALPLSFAIIAIVQSARLLASIRAATGGPGRAAGGPHP